MSYLHTITDPHSIITPIENGVTFPEVLDVSCARYKDAIKLFIEPINNSADSGDLLRRIRLTTFQAHTRMSLLKLFRRCVSLVCDTEMTKKITKVLNQTLIDNYSHTFKPISKLRQQFDELTQDKIAALAALLGEYDTRGQQGCSLTGLFFGWFENTLLDFNITGPRGAGRDIELSNIFTDFEYRYPCDFIVKHTASDNLVAVGFARYDSTRGGAQSDDRTGGNSFKVEKARQYCESTGRLFKLIFVSDGPGLAHNDTWQQACDLDGQWGDRVRVTTLLLAPQRITSEWLLVQEDSLS